MQNPRLNPFAGLVVLLLLGMPSASLAAESATVVSSPGQWNVGVAVNTCAKGQLRPCT